MNKPQLLILLLSAFITSEIPAQEIHYPDASKSNQTDVYHGVTVSDPYRWLEDDKSEATAKWVNDENQLTEQVLSVIPFRDSIKARMKDNFGLLRFEVPFRCGSSYYYYRYDGRNNQPLLFVKKTLEMVPFIYFDPNKISADGTTSISATVPSRDGKYMAFQISGAGSDWNEIRIKDVQSMKSLPEILSGVKFSNIAWYQDGFFYSRYDQTELQSSVNKNHKIYYHRLNTGQEVDSLVWSDKQFPLRNFSAYVTEDSRFLVISGSESTSGNAVYVADLSKPDKTIKPIVTTFKQEYDCIGSFRNRIYFLTDNEAPRKKIAALEMSSSGTFFWVDVVPHQTEILQSAIMSYDKLVLHYMKDASSQLVVYQRNGVRYRDVKLNSIGTIESLSGSQADSIMFFSFVTFTSPPVVYMYNIKTSTAGVLNKSPLTYNPDDFITEQVTYESKDGTKIPMFLIHKKGLQFNGETPTLLFGYGGFNISKTPEFKPERLVFLQNGGLLAVPNLRGGGEFGAEWHEAGTKLKKQNVFDDFIAAAEFLINKKYTNSAHLAIGGRSNGGLLVGASMTQRPDLFKVALPAVGVMDMLRFHKFTIGWAWTGDYGSSDNKQEFEALYKYSPYHNLKPGIKYPATMITTADHDDRVVPGHSFKFAARLQECQQGDNPVLIRVDKNAGHGSGKATSKLIDEQSDIFAFLFYHLGMTPR